MTTQEGSVITEARPCIIGFEDEERGTGAKECRPPVAAGRGKEWILSPGDTGRN